jgi:hypothetical protein
MCPDVSGRGRQALPIMSLVENIFGFVGHMVSVTTQLFHYHAKCPQTICERMSGPCSNKI